MLKWAHKELEVEEWTKLLVAFAPCTIEAVPPTMPLWPPGDLPTSKNHPLPPWTSPVIPANSSWPNKKKKALHVRHFAPIAIKFARIKRKCQKYFTTTRRQEHQKQRQHPSSISSSNNNNCSHKQSKHNNKWQQTHKQNKHKRTHHAAAATTITGDNRQKLATRSRDCLLCTEKKVYTTIQKKFRIKPKKL